MKLITTKLIIEIPKGAYEIIKDKDDNDLNLLGIFIKNGTPITEGDLISRKALKEELHKYVGLSPEDMEDIIDNAPTVEMPNWYKVYEDVKGTFERPQGDWIPVSERLPDDLEPVNITWINHDPEPYYKEIKDKPFTATGVYFNGQWYWWSTLCTDTLAEYGHNYDDFIDGGIEIIAWQPLPEAYKKGGADNGKS